MATAVASRSDEAGMSPSEETEAETIRQGAEGENVKEVGQ
jgi:hypothetical protein